MPSDVILGVVLLHEVCNEWGTVVLTFDPTPVLDDAVFHLLCCLSNIDQATRAPQGIDNIFRVTVRQSFQIVFNVTMHKFLGVTSVLTNNTRPTFSLYTQSRFSPSFTP